MMMDAGHAAWGLGQNTLFGLSASLAQAPRPEPQALSKPLRMFL